MNHRFPERASLHKGREPRRSALCRWVACVALSFGMGLVGLGCTGVVSGPDGANGPGSGPSPTDRIWDGVPPVPPESASLFKCDVEGTLDLERQGRRLTRDEIGHAIVDLFGPAVFAAAEADLAGLAPVAVSYRRETVSSEFTLEQVNRHFALFERVGRSAVESNALSSYVGCDGSVDTLSQNCVRELVTRLGLRVMRRPLDDEEIDHFTAVYADMGPESASGLVTSMLLSPSFLFQLEDGVPARGGGLVLSQFEIASRLSFMIQDSIPDEALLNLAAEGQLTGATFAAEAERLLTSERGRAKLKAFFRDWLAVRTVPPLADNAHLTGDLDADTFGADTLEELDRFVEYVVYEKRGTLADLLLGNEVFPHTTQLAAFYDVPEWRQGDPPRATGDLARGVVLRPPTLISGRSETSPILRGVFIKNHILCDEIPEPPNDDVIAEQEGMLDPSEYDTVRERTVVLTSAPECAGCHRLINPAGFALEDFDPVGRLRSEETHYDGSEVLATYPIDASVEDVLIDGQPVGVEGGAALVRAIVGSQRAAACFATTYFQFSQERSETDHNADRCQLARMHGQLEGTDGSVLGLLSAAFTEAAVSTRRVQ